MTLVLIMVRTIVIFIYIYSLYTSFKCVVKFVLIFNGIKFDCLKSYIFMIQLPFGACLT